MLDVLVSRQFNYQSKCHCTKTNEEALKYLKKFNYQSKCHCTKTKYEGGSKGRLTKSGGVFNYAGRTEMWYSSNVLYHKDTANWTPDANGVYRDKDGYVVIASSDHAKGTTLETSHGIGKVYDSGCASGVTDIYVNW